VIRTSLLPLVAIAGCGGGAAGSAVPGANPAMVRVAHAVRVDQRPSWMSPKAKSAKELLYVGDWDTNDVFVYDYPGGRPVGTLTGLSEPSGMCVDAKGDIYLTDAGGEVKEYAHGGKTPLKTYESGGDPIGCAVDVEGDLAVTSFSPGEFVVFAGGDPNKSTTYSDSACEYMWAGAYDGAGNLYAGGVYGAFAICELPAGATKMRTVTLSPPSYSGSGGFEWDGRHLVFTVITDESSTIVRVKESPATGDLTVTGTTALEDTCYNDYVDLANPFLLGKKNTPVNRSESRTVLGANLWCADAGTAKVDFWKYPQGGEPQSSLPNPPGAPYSAAVSIGK
jgi:hypothetical protein